MIVYVAGSFRGRDEIETARNMRRGIKTCIRLMKKGYTPFCPWFDFFYILMGCKMSRKDMMKYSLTWLKVADVMLVLPRSSKSEGTQKEIEVALHLNILICYKEIDLP